jgi:hypothetical protein
MTTFRDDSMTTFLDVLPVDFKQTSDLLHSKIDDLSSNPH